MQPVPREKLEELVEEARERASHITTLLSEGDAQGLIATYETFALKHMQAAYELHDVETRIDGLKSHVRINAARAIAQGSNAQARENIFEQHLHSTKDEDGSPLYQTLLESRASLSYETGKAAVKRDVADRAITLLASGNTRVVGSCVGL